MPHRANPRKENTSCATDPKRCSRQLIKSFDPVGRLTGIWQFDNGPGEDSTGPEYFRNRPLGHVPKVSWQLIRVERYSDHRSRNQRQMEQEMKHAAYNRFQTTHFGPTGNVVNISRPRPHSTVYHYRGVRSGQYRSITVQTLSQWGL